jgi:hypothetical protein
MRNVASTYGLCNIAAIFIELLFQKYKDSREYNGTHSYETLTGKSVEPPK